MYSTLMILIMNQISLSYSEILWPWAGWLAVQIAVKEEAASWSGSAHGHIEVTVESPNGSNKEGVQKSTVKLHIRAVIMPTPPRTYVFYVRLRQ